MNIGDLDVPVIYKESPVRPSGRICSSSQRHLIIDIQTHN